MDPEPDESSSKPPDEDAEPELAISKSLEHSGGSIQVKEQQSEDEGLLTETKSGVASNTIPVPLSTEGIGAEIEGSSSDTFVEAKSEIDAKQKSETTRELGARKKTTQVNDDTKSDVASSTTPVPPSREIMGTEREGSSSDTFFEAKPEINASKESETTRELGARKKTTQMNKETTRELGARKKTTQMNKDTRADEDTRTSLVSFWNKRTRQDRIVSPSFKDVAAKRAELDARWKSGKPSKVSGEVSGNPMLSEVCYMSASGTKHYTMDESSRGFIVSSVKEIQLTRKIHERKLWIRGSCILPDGSILLVDSNNNKLIKLDSDYNLISDLDLKRSSVDVCYIGNQTAAVSNESAIQFVDTSGKMKLENRVELKNKCCGIACHDDFMYIIDDNTLYRCTKNGTQVEEMLQRPSTGRGFTSVAVSYEEQMLYIALGDDGLLSLDIKRGVIHTGMPYKNCDLISACPIGDGTVFVCEFEKDNLLHIDTTGKTLLGQISLKGVCDPVSVCYDTQRCRVIVGYCYKDFVTVLELRSSKM